MVRLKAIEEELELSEYEFQFQYGTIKSVQFESISPEVFNFNSSMVRLKAYSITEAQAEAVFQFQYGTIKSWLRLQVLLT